MNGIRNKKITLNKGDTTHVYEVKCKDICDHSGIVAIYVNPIVVQTKNKFDNDYALLM